MPPHFVWADDARVHAFMRHSDPQNFGHLMVDDFLSAYTAGVTRSMHARSQRAHPPLISSSVSSRLRYRRLAPRVGGVVPVLPRQLRHRPGFETLLALQNARRLAAGADRPGLARVELVRPARIARAAAAQFSFMAVQVRARHVLQERAAGAQQRAQRLLLPPLACHDCKGVPRFLFASTGPQCRHQRAGVQKGQPVFLAPAGAPPPQHVPPTPLPLRAPKNVQVVLYQKTRGVMGSVWPEVCVYAADVQRLLPSAHVLCCAPHLMDLEQQLLMVASGKQAAAAKLPRVLHV